MLNRMQADLLSISECPDCHHRLTEAPNSTLECDSNHSFKVLDGVACFLPPQMLPKNFESLGLKAFSRRGHGDSWAANHWQNLKLGELLGRASIGKNRLLAFGAGPAKERKLMEDAGYQVVAMDIDPLEGVQILADGHQLPFLPSSFDAVTAFEVLEHLHSPWLAVQQIARVLKPGGRFIGSVAFIKPYHHSYFHMTHRGVIALLESAGLKVETVYGGQNPFIQIMGGVLPLGPRKFSNKIYGWIFRILMSARAKLWSLKHRLDPNQPLDRFDSSFPMSFNRYQQLCISPSVIFSAVKNA